MSLLDNNFDLHKIRLSSKSLLLTSVINMWFWGRECMGVHDNPADELISAPFALTPELHRK
jgi:hypothetical protein